VVRNRVKRRLRAVARDRLERLPDGALLVVRANPAAAGASSAELGAALDRALDRALRGARDRANGRAASGSEVSR
jgi:ribonuclease P protein component